MPDPQICAIIPAAGQGSRLGLRIPKILAPLGENRTVWTCLRDTLAERAGRLHVVISPAFVDAMGRAITDGPYPDRVSLTVQERPRGMGDAIFGASAVWKDFPRLLVVWGDQAGVSSETLRRTIATHVGGGHHPCCTLPVVETERPYVQYVFRDAALTGIRQAREGAKVDARGFSDVGVFLLDTEGLVEAWERYTGTAAAGALTGEVNFLPFLLHLSQQHGWRFNTVPVGDPIEARGINTPEDLAFFQERLRTPATV